MQVRHVLRSLPVLTLVAGSSVSSKSADIPIRAREEDGKDAGKA